MCPKFHRHQWFGSIRTFPRGTKYGDSLQMANPKFSFSVTQCKKKRAMPRVVTVKGTEGYEQRVPESPWGSGLRL